MKLLSPRLLYLRRFFTTTSAAKYPPAPTSDKTPLTSIYTSQYIHQFNFDIAVLNLILLLQL